MNITLRKIGNSDGIIIPKEMLNEVGLRTGDQLELVNQNGELRLKPVNADFARQLEHARKFMDRYKVALQKLAE